MLPKEIIPPREIIPPLEYMPPQEIIPPLEYMPPQEIIPQQEIMPPQDILPPRQIMPPQEIIPPREIIPSQEIMPLQEIMPPDEIVPLQELVPQPEIMPPQELPILFKPKPLEPFRLTERSIFLERATVLPPRPVAHSPKIAPSSIPNPSPSVTSTMEMGYSNYGGYLYNIPGYSAFHPLPYTAPPPYQEAKMPSEIPRPEFVPYPTTESLPAEEPCNRTEENLNEPTIDVPKPQTDFEENFSTEIIPPTVSEPEKVQLNAPSKLSITSLIQGSGATVTIPSQYTVNETELVIKPVDRFNLSTSNPSSKIDEKYVNTTQESIYQNVVPKTTNNSCQKVDVSPRVEIQSNIVIKPANIPTSKIDVKYVNNTPEPIYQNVVPNVKNNSCQKVETSPRVEIQRNVVIKPANIPTSKIDLKYVNNTPESIYQNVVPKVTYNSCQKVEASPRVEIQSNVVIKPANVDVLVETKDERLPAAQSPVCNSISTLINAAEAISKTESQFWKNEQKIDVATETSEPGASPPLTAHAPEPPPKPVFTPINLETTKLTFANKPEGNLQAPYNELKNTCPNKPEVNNQTPYNQQKNQIVFIQNKQNPSNPKMLVTIQQQNPQVLLHRTKFEPKNLQASSRLTNQSKKCKEEVSEAPSKVVALKRLHQENCDENDFENLITENQIYGNKIVVKEKSQGIQQEQDLKNNNKVPDKSVQTDTKNVVLQPNFLYLSNVQFPGNLMMIKNSSKINQNNDATKIIATTNENKELNEVNTTTTATVTNTTVKPLKTVAISKETNKAKSSNNTLHTLSNKSNKTDLMLQTNRKLIMSLPMIVDAESKVNQQIIYPKGINPKKVEKSKSTEQTKKNEKLYITCPYQMDPKLQPKIVLTNIRHKVSKVDEVSSLDIYEKRRRNRRLKYLSKRDNRESKLEIKKTDKLEILKNIITPEKMEVEICKEFANTKMVTDEGSEESESDFGEGELNEYNSIIKEFGNLNEDKRKQVEFLAGFRLATHNAYKEKTLALQERILKTDAVAAAYVAAGRLDRLSHEVYSEESCEFEEKVDNNECLQKEEGPAALHKKYVFLSHLQLVHVTPQYKEDYERSWQAILKERKRRNGETILRAEELVKKTNSFATPKFDPNSTLQLLTEIQKCVHETNNVIKKRLDTFSDENSNECTIKSLADKNFSDLDRLSKMADKSLKLFSGEKTRKRDLNPGFDSENIQTAMKYEPQVKNYPKINIPCYNKVESVKTGADAVTKSPTAPVEDDKEVEGKEQLQGISRNVESKDFSCQVSEAGPWPGVEALIKSYREHDAGHRREVAELQRRHTALRVEGAMITRAASRDSDRARALLGQRRLLAREEAGLRRALQRLVAAVRAVRDY